MAEKTKRKAATRANASLHDVGSAAGEVWRFLHANGPSTADSIKGGTQLAGEVVYAAIGWLARENQLVIEGSGKKTKVALK